MRYAMILALAVGVTACETGEMEETRTEPASETALETGVTPETTGPASATIRVATLPDGGGQYLTDGDGRALYVLENETEPDACVDACATEWPPFTAQPGGEPMASGAQQDLIGTVDRPDGTTQIAYDGQPLYYYAEDAAPGETKGQDVTDEWGEWYLVQPTGELLEEAAEAGA
ncbi:MAG TPA: hypothetical protein VMN78_04875 [Longimicrobiales bacterium]|nr:hypothetical protein [Longimicrobiales bacterium]